MDDLEAAYLSDEILKRVESGQEQTYTLEELERELKEKAMSQVTISLDEQTDKKLRQAVEHSGLSKSQWITRLIKEKTSTEWPEVVREMVGEWQDVPEQEEIRKTEGKDLPRESL